MTGRVVTTQQMKKAKETKGTFVYGETTEGTPVQTLYISKKAFPNGAPEKIQLTIEELSKDEAL